MQSTCIIKHDSFDISTSPTFVVQRLPPMRIKRVMINSTSVVSSKRCHHRQPSGEEGHTVAHQENCISQRGACLGQMFQLISPATIFLLIFDSPNGKFLDINNTAPLLQPDDIDFVLKKDTGHPRYVRRDQKYRPHSSQGKPGHHHAQYSGIAFTQEIVPNMGVYSSP